MPRKRQNSKRPSLIGEVTDTFVPTEFMERMAKGARGDFERLTGGFRSHRNPDDAVEIARHFASSYHSAPSTAIKDNIRIEFSEWVGRLNDEDYRIAQKIFTSSLRPNPARRRNPEDTAALAYEIFHGKPPQGYTEVIEEIQEHENLWVLGALEKLVINTRSGYKATWEFTSDKPLLCGNEPAPGSVGLFQQNMVCTQLYVRGGDQALALAKCKMGEETKWWKEEMVIGELEEITYHTQKGFDKFKPVDYYHELGEEGGDIPQVIYDTRNHLLSIAGGQYEIRAEGITD